jgi:hypothetical protein
MDQNFETINLTILLFQKLQMQNKICICRQTVGEELTAMHPNIYLL